MSNKSVQVAVRVRPLVKSEIEKGCKDVVEVFSDINQIRIKDTEKAFTYNYVFDSNSTQYQIYNSSIKQMIQSLFTGYNLTVLAYGQTGSGKTHTMGTICSTKEEMGVISQAVTDIFQHITDNCSHNFTVTVSFMELYQETLYDLLSEKSREQCILDIREDQSKGIFIPGLTQIPVHGVKDVFQQLMLGSSCRATSSTNMNSQSSRSHAIFTVNLVMQNKINGDEKTAKFHLVDLAGSERQKKTGAVGTTFKEGVNINKGLLVLGNVISALGDEKQQQGYIPYRDSNLTRLLKDSLGGNSITLMIACISPSDYNVEETMSTLRYADRARRIQNKPIINQDPKAAEIQFLKKTIQDLKLQIIDQGGPAVCSEKVSKTMEDNSRLQAKVRDLSFQLSSTLNDNMGLLEKLIILQNANETLHKKTQQLKNQYGNVLDNINLSLKQNDHEAIKMNFGKLQQIQDEFKVIDSEQQRAEIEILNHEQSMDLHNSQNSQIGHVMVADMSRDQENYTNKQIALNIELQELTKELAMKEHLARQIITNTQYLVDYNGMVQNEEKIGTLQKEKNELLQQLKNAHAPAAKIFEQRKKRVQELENQMQELNKKVQEQAHLIKLKEKDVSKINQLNKEILQMKQTRVKLIRKMRDESDRFRSWKIQRERELAKLKEQDRKKQNQLIRMEAIHCKQQNVLKRKIEEAVALNKRLKDALALRKATQDAKNSGKKDKIGQWIMHELDVQMHLIEAEATLTGLLEDRALLQQQLDQLIQNTDCMADEEFQISSIQEDIELRSVQIHNLQQKILDSDEENKKFKLENIQTMNEAKLAVKILLARTAEIKRNEVVTKNKFLEIQGCLSDVRQKYESLDNLRKEIDSNHSNDVACIQKDYEEKIAVLLRQLRGVEVQDANEELKQRCGIQTEKIETLDKMNQELVIQLLHSQEQVNELREKAGLVTNAAQESQQKVTEVEQTKTPEAILKKELSEIGRNSNESQESLDLSCEEDIDDLEKDPDWKQTPIGKWILERKKQVFQKNQSEQINTNQTFKRTSEGGCMCTKSNCSTRCGCRKTNQKCSARCRCPNSCINKFDDSNTLEESNKHDKKPRLLLQQNLFQSNTKKS